MVNLVSVNGDGAERTRRAEVLTGTATDAPFFFDGRDTDGDAVDFFLDEVDRIGRAVTGTVAALFDLTIVHKAE
jgi:hypothetical protein